MSTIRFIQAQTFALQASGASSGDTTITLQSFKQIDGTTNIVTADLGDKAYATLEPNNGTQEEAISFTGVTQNASGTATLTGVKSVGFVSPYTESSGLAKSHAGGVTVILSNDAGFYGNIISYVNTVAGSGAALADTTTAGISKLSVAAVTGSNPIAVGDNDPRILATGVGLFVKGIQGTGIPYAVATGTATAYTVTLASAYPTLASGTTLNFLVPVSNATSITLNVNSIGAKNIYKKVNVALASGDLQTGQIADVTFDGTNFQLQSPVSSEITQIKIGGGSMDISASTTRTFPHGLGVVPRYVDIRAVVSTGSDSSIAMGLIANSLASGIAVNGTAVDSQFSVGVAASGIRVYTLTADATNIILTNGGTTNSPTGTATVIFTAYA